MLIGKEASTGWLNDARRMVKEFGPPSVPLSTMIEWTADWLARGYAGEMGYMHRHAEARRHPASILAEVRSVVMVGMNYEASRERQRPEDGSPCRNKTSGR